MKIRQGFVSNSSSSSFYIKDTKGTIPFDEIAKYYEFNPEIPEEYRVWMQILVWMALKSNQKMTSLSEEEKEDVDRYDSYEEDNSTAESDLNSFLSDENIEWFQSNPYYHKEGDYWEKAKKLAHNPDGVLHFSVEDNGEPVYFPGAGFGGDEVKLPWDVAYEIRRIAEDLFLNPEKASGISE